MNKTGIMATTNKSQAKILPRLFLLTFLQQRSSKKTKTMDLARLYTDQHSASYKGANTGSVIDLDSGHKGRLLQMAMNCAT